MLEDLEGFIYPKIDKAYCINCNLCKKVCPILNRKEQIETPVFYGSKNKDGGIRLKSSSGGIFFSIAEYVISNDGIVFGAAFVNNMVLEHIEVDNIEGLYKLMGSKYLQSNIKNTYSKVEQYLKKNKIVLFTGTPCQIAGLKTYLQKDYEHLYLVDVVCHGAPSPKVFREYIEELSTLNETEIKDIYFRDKRSGWVNANVAINFKNGKDIVIPIRDNIYHKGFIGHLYLRPSCHNCNFNYFKSGSDITIGDFWGIKDSNPEFYDDKGVSLVIVKTDIGQKIFKKISDNLDIIKSGFNEAINANPHICISAKPHMNRHKFFNQLNKKNSTISKIIQSNLSNYDLTNKGIKFGILGSYNSRASLQKLTLNTDNKIEWHFSNSSIISLLSSPLSIQRKDLEVGNIFKGDALYWDLSKYFIINTKELLDKVDYLIIDLIEERHDIIKYKESFITKTDTFDESGLSSKLENTTVIKRLDSESFRLWKDICLNFTDYVLRYINPNKIILNEIYLSEIYNDGGSSYYFADIDSIREINHILAEYYEYFLKNYKGVNIISLNKKDNICDRFHSYGCHPYHLNDDAYKLLADQIFDIVEKQ